jgi:hypothetical protein
LRNPYINKLFNEEMRDELKNDIEKYTSLKQNNLKYKNQS